MEYPNFKNMKPLLSVPAEIASIHIDSLIEMLQNYKSTGAEFVGVVYHTSDAGTQYPMWGDEIWFVDEKHFDKVVCANPQIY